MPDRYRLSLLTILLFCILLLPSCGGETFTVDVLAVGEGGAVVSGTPLQQIPYGEDVSISVTVPDGEDVIQVFLDDVLTDTYTFGDGILTLPEITAPCTVRIVAGEADTKAYWEVDAMSKNGGYVRSNVPEGAVPFGSMITLTAVPREGAVFLGWTERFALRSGGKLLSEKEQVTVEITDNYTYLIANYDASGVAVPEPKPVEKPVHRGENTLNIFYHNNGGNVLADNKVAIETTFDTSYWIMPFGREDDGKLQKDGYVLLGYSYSPDGTGELIRPGYKYFRQSEDMSYTLYCVWQKETDPSLFTVSEADKNSLQIDRYNGTDSVVYIPRKIQGKTVTKIGSGAFAGNTALTEVHITSSIHTVEDGAFSDCPNLTAVTLYDNLRKVSDASFSGSPVKTVRLCAATSPRYIDSYIAFGKKFERLVTTADTERIIIVAGSSKYWGLDCDYMESLIDDRYSVVNYGTSVGMNIMFFLEAVSSYLTETDVLVYSPELYGSNSWQTNGNTELPSATFQGIANSYNLLERVDASRYPNFFSSFAEFVAGRLQMGEVRWDSWSDSIDQYGDYTKFRTDLNTPDYYLGVMGDFHFDEIGVPPEFLPNLNLVLDSAASSGAKIYFSFPPYNKNAVADGYLNDAAYDYYMQYIRENIHAELISDVRYYIHEGQFFDDSDYHLNAIGRPIHTGQLTADLAAMGIVLAE